jgi:hypothetical protein
MDLLMASRVLGRLPTAAHLVEHARACVIGDLRVHCGSGTCNARFEELLALRLRLPFARSCRAALDRLDALERPLGRISRA